MKLYESMVAHARPQDIRPNAIFTEKVMTTITSKQSERISLSRFAQRIHKNPVMAALAITVGVTVVAGAAYATVQLWPRITTSLTGVGQNDGQTVLSVYADNCGVNKEKRYKVMNGSELTPEQAPQIVAAECNMRAISDWTQKTYPEVANANGAIGRALPNKPGNVAQNVQMPASPVAARVTALSKESVTVQQPGSAPEVYAITSDTSIIVDHANADTTKLKVGDAVATFVSTKETLKADPDCTVQDCHYSVVEGATKRSLLMVATLDQPLEFYKTSLRTQIYELTPCMGNPADVCTFEGSAVELYTQYLTDDLSVPHGNTHETPLRDGYEPAKIQGKVTTWNAGSITITTSSGRSVTVNTSSNLIDRYNLQRAAEFNYTITAGDTIDIDYVHPKGIANDTIINDTFIGGIKLKVATLGKGDQSFRKF